MTSTRQEKVNSFLQREIAEYILRQDYEGISGFLTVTRASVTADLELANIYFSVIGQEAQEVLEILKKHIYEIQGYLNSRLAMKKFPKITFVIDDRGEYASNIGKLLKDLPK